jgi:RNA polymerase sigma factor (sigma-70 family)
VGRGLMVMEAPVQATTSRPLDESDEDGALVAAVRRGDERAFEALYARYQRRISAYVFGMVKDHGRAEDITQDVFISALRRMRETERPIVFKPWIYEIAKNACIDQFRRTRRTEEVSFDGAEGLGSADQGRLIASQPTPDAAVNAKQQLDHLCGAFGGLSESHHEILVLRELEGLSYREIGERMGLSRPGVESTLFRARRRLTEEYDELVSGQRCLRIQGIIAGAAEAAGTIPGARDSKRLARHIAHCQPCRRQAVLAGVDTTALPRPVRRRIAEKVAGLLPFPAFLRPRWMGGSHMAGPASDPAVAGWSTVAAAAATVVLAGGGVGIATHGFQGSASPSKPPARTSTPTNASAGATAPAFKHASRVSGGLTPGRAAKQSSGSGRSTTSAPRQSNASTPAAGAPASSQSFDKTPSHSSGSGGSGGGPKVPDVQVPEVPEIGGAPPQVNQTIGAVNPTVGGVGGAVNGTVGQVEGTVDDVTAPLPDVPPLP